MMKLSIKLEESGLKSSEPTMSIIRKYFKLYGNAGMETIPTTTILTTIQCNLITSIGQFFKLLPQLTLA